MGLEEDDAVGPHACPSGADRADHRRVSERPRGLRSGVDHDEVIAGAAHLVERPTNWNHAAPRTWCVEGMRPVIAHSRSLQTIHTASRTIAPDILLCPSVRSTKTIGISTILQPFLQARKLISI